MIWWCWIVLWGKIFDTLMKLRPNQKLSVCRQKGAYLGYFLKRNYVRGPAQFKYKCSWFMRQHMLCKRKWTLEFLAAEKSKIKNLPFWGARDNKCFEFLNWLIFKTYFNSGSIKWYCETSTQRFRRKTENSPKWPNQKIFRMPKSS